MRLIIEARLEGNDIEPTVVPIPLAVIDRYDDDLEQLGLSLAEGRELLAAAQSVVVSSQASRWIATQDYCHECYTPIRRKDSRSLTNAARKIDHRAFVRAAINAGMPISLGLFGWGVSVLKSVRIYDIFLTL